MKKLLIILLFFSACSTAYKTGNTQRKLKIYDDPSGYQIGYYDTIYRGKLFMGDFSGTSTPQITLDSNGILIGLGHTINALYTGYPAPLKFTKGTNPVLIENGKIDSTNTYYTTKKK